MPTKSTKSPQLTPRTVLRTIGGWFYRHHYVSAYLLGSLYYGLNVYWMYGLRTAEIATGTAFVIVAISAALLMTSSFAIGFVLFVFLWRRLKLSFTGSQWWLIPAVWVLTEYLRAVLFSLVALGPGGRIGPYWTFGNVGYWLARTPVVYASRWGGLYMLSLIVAAFVVTLVYALKTRNSKPLIVTLLLTTTLSLSGWLVYRMSDGPIRSIGVMQFASEFSPDNFSTSTAEQLNNQPAHQYDTLIMPEYSHLWENASGRDTASITRALKEPEGLVIDSVQEKSSNTALGHNLITYHKADGTALFTQQKWFSIPGGEYVPYGYQILLAYVGQEQLLLHFNDQKSINHGDVPEKPFVYKNVSWGSMACSGVIAPDLYRGMAGRGATVLTNSASLDTMGFSMGYHYQVREMAILHAVANARPFAQSARGGLSYILDKDGHFLAQTTQRGYEFLEVDIQSNSTVTLYTLLGDWVVVLAVGTILGGIVVRRSRSKKSSIKKK